MARPRNTYRRRQEIVSALGRVMARRGYSGASVKVIAEEAGLAPGLVHYHFSNKREILVALVERLEREIEDRFHVRREANPEDEVAAFVDAHLALGSDARGESVACWIAIAAEAVHEPEVREVYQRALARGLCVLEGILDRVAVPGPRNATVARGLMAAIQGLYSLSLVSLVPRGSASDTVRLFARSVLGEESR